MIASGSPACDGFFVVLLPGLLGLLAVAVCGNETGATINRCCKGDGLLVWCPVDAVIAGELGTEIVFLIL